MRLPFLAITLVTLCACTTTVEKTFDQTSSASSEESSSLSSVMPAVDTGSWLHYRSEKLGVEFVYPAFYKAESESPSTTSFDRGGVTVEVKTDGVYLGDGIPEGQGIQVSRTHDAAMLEMMNNEYTHFIATKMFNGIEYREYSYDGMGEPAIYIGLKNDYIYSIMFIGGLNNPETEQIMRSFKILD